MALCLHFFSESANDSGHLEGHENLDCMINDLNPTKNRESSEEPHGASNETKLGLNCQLLVSLDLVVGRWHKVELDQVQWGKLFW